MRAHHVIFKINSLEIVVNRKSLKVFFNCTLFNKPSLIQSTQKTFFSKILIKERTMNKLYSSNVSFASLLYQVAVPPLESWKYNLEVTVEDYLLSNLFRSISTSKKESTNYQIKY